MKQADTDIIALLREIRDAGSGGGGGAETDPLALKIANDLSDLSNVGNARTNLGLVIGTHVQAYSANLDTFAGIAPTANVQSLLGGADYAAMRTQLGLVIGTDIQAFDADLATWAGITPASGVDTFLVTPTSANLRAALTDELGTGAALFDGATPTSFILTNATGLPVSTGIAGLGTGVATFLATPSSANLLAALTTKTGTGDTVFANTPTLVTPIINGLPTGTGVAAAATASTLVARDASGDITTRDLITGTGRFITLRGGVTLSSSAAGLFNFTAAPVGNVQALSGAGAVSATTYATAFTSTGAAQALTLADGVNGQTKIISHVADGGSGVLTPTTKSGYSTITFNNAGDSVTLQFFTTAGWVIIGSYGVTIAP